MHVGGTINWAGMSQSRRWCFTLNNPTPEDLDRIEAMMECAQYGVVGDEVGASGTPHCQGFVFLKMRKTLGGMRQFLPTAHFEIARGTIAQASDYCKKDGKFREYGTFPEEPAKTGADAERNRWKRIREEVTLAGVEAVTDDCAYITHYANLKSIAKDHPLPVGEAAGLTGIWYYGVSGAGKSRRARTEYPVHYAKNCNKWWDGYTGQDSVIIDDWDPSHACLGHHLKIWADRYPFNAETKGGSVMIRPKRIIVTSQYHPDQIWADEPTQDAIRRRFTVILVGDQPPAPPPAHSSFQYVE